MSAWEAYRREAAADRGAIRAGLAHAGPEERGIAERALALLDAAAPARDAEAHGGLAALLLGRLRDRATPLWLSIGGPGFAVACATHERRLVATHLKRGASLDVGVRWLARRAHAQTAITLDMPTWQALAGPFRKLRKDERPAAEAEVRAARDKGLPVGLACWVDALAELPAEAAEDALAAVALADADWSAIEEWVIALVPALEDPAPARAVLERASAVGLVHRLAPHARALVALVGADAAPTLARVLRDALQSTLADKAAAKRFAQALATIEHPALDAFFVQHVESRAIGEVAAAYVAAHGASASARARSRATEIHAAALEKTEERSRRAKSAARKTTARRRHSAAVGQATEAAWDDVPAVLRDPPWRGALPALPEARLAAIPTDVSLDRLELLGGPRREAGERYFVQHGEDAAVALLPLLAARDRRAFDALAVIARADALAVRRAALRAGAGEAEADAIVRAARLCDCPDRATAPDWDVPPVLLAGGARLPDRAATHLLEMATFADPDAPYVGLAEVKATCDRTSLDAFAAALFREACRDKDAEGWGFAAAAALGGGETARAMLKAMREWNKTRAGRERAITLVRAMAAGGVDAVGALSAQVRRSRGAIAEAAEDVLRAIARREGLSADELAEVATPDLDLDASGVAVLDFGPRALRVTLGDDLAARVTDEAGRVVTSVRAQRSDDPAKAQVATARLRDLRKGLGEVARAAAARFEQGMVLGREWRADLFWGTVIGHPILGRIARRLLWARGAELVRVAEDGTLADLAGDERPRGGALRPVHPLELDARALAQWGEVFAEHAILPPFPQIGRATFAPTEAERSEGALARFRGAPTTQMAIQGRLLARGWERIASGGFVSGWVRRLRGATAQYMLADPIVGDAFVNETTLGAVTFGVPLAKVPPIAFSEAAYDLHVLAE